MSILVAGEIYADLIMSGFDFFPQPGQEAFARKFHREVGGGAAITACGLGVLGSPVRLFAIAGCDHHAWIASRLSAHGVDTSLLMADAEEPTGFTVAVTAPSDRTFFSYLGANRRFAAELTRLSLTGVRHVHLAWAPPWDLAPALFDRIHTAGATISLDAGWHEDWLSDPRALPALREIDLFFPNETEGACLTGEADPGAILRRFAEAGMPGVALKLGPKGARLLLGGSMYEAPTPAVYPVDTTGAGDCFDAGFLHAWLGGRSPEVCLALGNLCGALSTESYGGLAGFPSRGRVQTELKL